MTFRHRIQLPIMCRFRPTDINESNIGVERTISGCRTGQMCHTHIGQSPYFSYYKNS